MAKDDGHSLDSLKERHQELDQLLRAEEQALAPDQLRVSQLKREKLRLKDQIAALSQA